MGKHEYNPLPQLIDFAYELNHEDLPKDVAHEAKRRIIDALGCAIGSLTDERVKNLIAYIGKNPVRGNAAGFTLCMEDQLPFDRAAFLNTTMIRWLDWNDTYLGKEPAHPSDNLGLLLALAAMKKLSGKDLMLGAVIAYDIQCRLTEAASLRARGWDHVNYLLISATLAGAKLLGMSKRQMYDAVALALNPNIALRQARAGNALSEWKGAAAGGAVRGAAFALELAQAGFRGPDEIMEGEFGFLNQVSGPLAQHAFADLGTRFLLPETYIKKYPVEYHAQAAVDQTLSLRKFLNNAPLDEVESITIRTYEAALRIIGDATKRRPTTKETADHSLYYAVAVSLAEGEMTLKQYRENLYRDPKILACMDATTIVEIPEYTARYRAVSSERGFPNYLTIVLKNGTTLESMIEYPSGHPRNPMSDEDVSDKLQRLMHLVMPSFEWIIPDVLWRMEQIAEITSINMMLPHIAPKEGDRNG